MMTDRNDAMVDLLDRYCDGLLDTAGRRAFERRLANDAALQAQVQRQRFVDTWLKGRFVAPDAAALIPLIERAASNDRPRSRALLATRAAWRRVAVAAVLALGIVGVYRIWHFFNPPPVRDVYAEQPWRPLHEAYAFEVRDGFKSYWVCKDDRRFRGTFRRRLGQPLLLSALPDNVTALGLAYRNTISPQTIALLARVEGREVMVFIDRTEVDAGQTLPPESKLKLFRRRIDRLVLYELTPLEKPSLLERFYSPDRGSKRP